MVIPVYDEAPFLARNLERVFRADCLGLDVEVVVVDDGSSDGSAEIAQAFLPLRGRLQVVRHSVNRGKDAAVRTGLARATGDDVLIPDTDLEYDPADYPALLAPLLAGTADAVYGFRFGKGEPRFATRWHRLGNRLLTWLANWRTGLRLTDKETGYKTLTRPTADALTLTEDRFGVEPEITCELARTGSRVVEVAGGYRSRSFREGKKLRSRDGLEVLRCL